MRVFLIHGAGASPLSWRTVIDRLGYETETFSYDVNQPFSTLSHRCELEIRDSGCEIVVGHSFGGVLAWHSARSERVVGGISIAAPWAGSRYADLVEGATLGSLPSRFFANVARSSPHLVEPRVRPAPVPWMSIIATRGVVSYGPDRNDGVLTVSSQDSLYHSDNVTRVELPFSHSEVLHSDETIEHLRWFVRRCSKSLRRV